MKGVGLLCALAALAACAENDGTGDSETRAANAAQAGWTLAPGTYEYTRDDGAAGLLVLAADGTYADAISGGDLETGTWAVEKGRSCLAPAGSAAGPCYRFSAPDARGQVTGTIPGGATLIARKLE